MWMIIKNLVYESMIITKQVCSVSSWNYIQYSQHNPVYTYEYWYYKKMEKEIFDMNTDFCGRESWIKIVKCEWSFFYFSSRYFSLTTVFIQPRWEIYALL